MNTFNFSFPLTQLEGRVEDNYQIMANKEDNVQSITSKECLIQRITIKVSHNTVRVTIALHRQLSPSTQVGDEPYA